MVVNTVIGIGTPRRSVHAPSTPLPRATATNAQADAARQHERIMDYRRRLNEMGAKLNSAMESLASANMDIDRLNAEIARLNAELQKEREKNAKASDMSYENAIADSKVPKSRKAKVKKDMAEANAGEPGEPN